MLPLLWWGLPSRDDDPILFGGPAWPAERFAAERKIASLDPSAGADTDPNPVRAESRGGAPPPCEPIDLTKTEADRAEILSRYRLYSAQPDEQLILRGLRSMRPAALQFDPGIYQYGGAYFGGVGASLAVAGVLGVVPLRPNVADALAAPERFARVYVVMRMVSLLFGAAALVAAYRLARGFGGAAGGFVAAATAACSPVFICAVSEAKPHLPAACVALWTVLATWRAMRGRGRRAAMAAGALAGASFALVLTGVTSLLVLVGICVGRAAPVGPAVGAGVRPIPRWRSAAFALLCAAVVFVAMNPYLVHHALFAPERLRSNLGNSLAMYEGQATRIVAGAGSTAYLFWLAIGPVVGVVGLLGAWLAARGDWRRTLVAALPGGGIVLIAVLTQSGKPAEAARFLILPSLLLCVAAGAAVGRGLPRRSAWAQAGLVALIASAALSAPRYAAAYGRELGGGSSRRAAAQWLSEQVPAGDAIGVLQEPAPYAVPPLNFAQRRIVLMPGCALARIDPERLPEWIVFCDDGVHAARLDPLLDRYALIRVFPRSSAWLAPVTWADKPVFILQRRIETNPGAGGALPAWPG